MIYLNGLYNHLKTFCLFQGFDPLAKEKFVPKYKKKGRSSTGGVERRKKQVAHEDQRVSNAIYTVISIKYLAIIMVVLVACFRLLYIFIVKHHPVSVDSFQIHSGCVQSKNCTKRNLLQIMNDLTGRLKADSMTLRTLCALIPPAGHNQEDCGGQNED